MWTYTEKPLMKDIRRPLAKNILIKLVLTAAASAADAGNHKKFLNQGKQFISNEKMDDIMKIV